MSTKKRDTKKDPGHRPKNKPKGAGRTKQFLPSNNLFAIITILFIISSAFSSYISYEKSRNIAEELTGKVSAQARLCLNKQPSISQNCSTTAEIGVGYYCDVDGTDPDNDTLSFHDNTALFDIDPVTGEIIFTPDASDAGNHNIMITASDGKGCSNSNATTMFTLYIPAPPGPSPGPGGGGGGGGAPRECIPQWECTPWSMCRPDGTRTRECYTLNNCLVDKPEEERGCIYVLPPAPRKRPYPEYYLCNFDIEDECFASFGMRENWIYTYKAKNSTIIIDSLPEDGADVLIDQNILFFAGLKRINSVDVTGDGINDFEYIPHRISDGRIEMTVRLIEREEVVLERPVYIWRTPSWLAAIMIFFYDNACTILILLLALLSVLVWKGALKAIQDKKAKKGIKKNKSQKKH